MLSVYDHLEAAEKVVTPCTNNKRKGYTTRFTLTHEPTGFYVIAWLTGTKDHMLQIANVLAGPDWTQSRQHIYQNPAPYQEALRRAKARIESKS